MEFYTLLSNLIDEAHGPGLPEVIKNKMIVDLALQLEQRLSAAVADDLPEVEQIRFHNALLEPKDWKTAERILQQYIPNYKTIMQTVMTDFRQEYFTVCQK